MKREEKARYLPLPPVSPKTQLATSHCSFFAGSLYRTNVFCILGQMCSVYRYEKNPKGSMLFICRFQRPTRLCANRMQRCGISTPKSSKRYIRSLLPL